MTFERVPLRDIHETFLSTSTEISSVALNGHVVSVSDEFFAEAKQLLEVGAAPSLKGRFGPKGALYSGWESRRHNPTFDWCIIKLGPPSGYIVGFDIDTSNFSGNEAPEASVEACFVAAGEKCPSWSDNQWKELLTKVPLGPNSRHLFKIPQTSEAYTHVKLNMYPDGGIARFRVYGIVSPVFPADQSIEIDLAHVLSGGHIVRVSDQHFGAAPNVLLPGRGIDMGDGWETKRSRAPGHNDWLIIQLGARGFLSQVELDTLHFIGNFPESCTIHALDSTEEIPDVEHPDWVVVLERSKLGPNRRHFFPLNAPRNLPFTHVKVTIYPDGGLKRVRIMGTRFSVETGLRENIFEAFSTPQIGPELGDKNLTSLPTLIESNERKVPAVPLTKEAFATFGDVIQAWANPLSVPRTISITPANNGTAQKFDNLTNLVSSYPDGVVTSPPRVSVYRCSPPPELVGAVGVLGAPTHFEVKILERHAHTNQLFIPMGVGATHGVEEDLLPTAARGYLIVVALNGADDKPDLKSLRAFVASTSQGIAYHTGIWHHPMIALEEAIDFTCIETQSGLTGSTLDCEVVQVGEIGAARLVVQIGSV